MDGWMAGDVTLSLFGVQQGVKGDQEDANGIPALSINSPRCGQKIPVSLKFQRRSIQRPSSLLDKNLIISPPYSLQENRPGPVACSSRIYTAIHRMSCLEDSTQRASLLESALVNYLLAVCE